MRIVLFMIGVVLIGLCLGAAGFATVAKEWQNLRWGWFIGAAVLGIIFLLIGISKEE